MGFEFVAAVNAMRSFRKIDTFPIAAQFKACLLYATLAHGLWHVKSIMRITFDELQFRKVLSLIISTFTYETQVLGAWLCTIFLSSAVANINFVEQHRGSRTAFGIKHTAR